MAPHLHIRRLDAELSGPDLEGRLRGGLASALDRRLEAALREAGLGPEADVAVRALEVEIDEAAAEERWAEAVVRGLAKLLDGARALGAAGGADERIASFPSRISSGRAALLAVARQGAAPWWWASLVGPEQASRLARPEGVEALLRDWIERDPAAAPTAVARLLVEAPETLARLEDEGGARLLDALLTGRARRREELRGAAGGPGETGSAPGADGSEEERALGSALATTLSGAEVAGLRRLAPRVAIFGAACLALRAAPGLARPDALGVCMLRALESAPGGAHPRTTISSAPASPPTGSPPATDLGASSAAPPLAPGAPRRIADHRPAGSAPPAPAASLAFEQPVGLGGLLFLLRWLARDPLLTDANGRFAPRLASFAQLVLERVLAPLPPEQRARQRREHQPLLEVFAGSESTNADPAGLEAARRALARLQEALPVGLEARPEAIAWIFRAQPDALALLAPEDRDLAALVLRPGRLRIEAHSAVLALSSRFIDINIRKGAWDLDPGWYPWTGRVIRFRYLEEP